MTSHWAPSESYAISYWSFVGVRLLVMVDASVYLVVDVSVWLVDVLVLKPFRVRSASAWRFVVDTLRTFGRCAWCWWRVLCARGHEDIEKFRANGLFGHVSMVSCVEVL